MFHSIEAKDLSDSLFTNLQKTWMLIAANDGEKCNAMTAGWGGVGVIWGKPSAACFVRPQRYTKELLDREEFFTLSFYGEEHREALNICGADSGRDVDKVQKCGFHVCRTDCGAPYFEEADLVIVCKKKLAQPLDPATMTQEVKEKWYAREDYHVMYIGEIVEVLKK